MSAQPAVQATTSHLSPTSNRGSESSAWMTTPVRLMTGFVAFFTLLPGLAKFFEPFHTFLAVQIARAELPLPTLSYVAAQAGEIAVGATLVGLLVFLKKVPASIARPAFQLANLVVLPLMSVAVYVHLHPAVPAEVLPFESKPPVLASLVLAFAAANLLLTRRSAANEQAS